MSDLIETTPRWTWRSKILSTWWRSCAPITPSTVPLFQRREQREAAHTYLQGLLAPLPRKSIEPMVLAVDGVAPKAVRAMQSFISEGQWNDERLLHQHWKEVETDLGADDGVLMVDGSDFPKQGVHSVGVKRQYCGELGKRANCQAGVFVGYVSSQGYTVAGSSVVCARGMAHRRRVCGTAQAVRPAAEITFKTKPALAQEMLAAVVQSQALRCRWVVADEAFGGNPGFLDGVAGLGLWYFAEVPHTHAGLGRAPGHPRPAVAWARPSPAAGAPGGGRPRGADGAGGGGGAARRGVDTPDDQGRQPGTHGGGVCRPAGGRRAGRLARS